ncbi:hypothetical protein BDW75DRAFT_76091 [Aspergillus navahoensis]
MNNSRLCTSGSSIIMFSGNGFVHCVFKYTPRATGGAECEHDGPIRGRLIRNCSNAVPSLLLPPSVKTRTVRVMLSGGRAEGLWIVAAEENWVCGQGLKGALNTLQGVLGRFLHVQVGMVPYLACLVALWIVP